MYKCQLLNLLIHSIITLQFWQMFIQRQTASRQWHYTTNSTIGWVHTFLIGCRKEYLRLLIMHQLAVPSGILLTSQIRRSMTEYLPQTWRELVSFPADAGFVTF
jgi:hypothetical protein